MGESFDGLGQLVSLLNKQQGRLLMSSTPFQLQRRLYARHLPQIPHKGGCNSLLVSTMTES